MPREMWAPRKGYPKPNALVRGMCMSFATSWELSSGFTLETSGLVTSGR